MVNITLLLAIIVISLPKPSKKTLNMTPRTKQSNGGATPGRAKANALAEIPLALWQSKVVTIKLYIKIF